MMDKAKLEYIWLDGYEPTQNMRSKTMVRSNFTGTLEECPMWMFDGSSTRQADGSSSDCLLKPVNIFPDPQRVNGYLVMCEVMNPDGTPHPSNGRATIDDDDDDFWFGFEQEYFIMDVDTQLPLGFPVGGYPGPQGLYYCSVGGKNTHGRSLVEEHADLCLEAVLIFFPLGHSFSPPILWTINCIFVLIFSMLNFMFENLLNVFHNFAELLEILLNVSTFC